MMRENLTGGQIIRDLCLCLQAVCVWRVKADFAAEIRVLHLHSALIDPRSGLNDLFK